MGQIWEYRGTILGLYLSTTKLDKMSLFWDYFGTISGLSWDCPGNEDFVAINAAQLAVSVGKIFEQSMKKFLGNGNVP